VTSRRHVIIGLQEVAGTLDTLLLRDEKFSGQLALTEKSLRPRPRLLNSS
jgi:hypothetical protein